MACNRMRGPRHLLEQVRGVENTPMEGALMPKPTLDHCTACGLSKVDHVNAFRVRVRGARTSLSSKCVSCVKVRNDKSKQVRRSRGCSSGDCHRPHDRNGLCFTHANQQAAGQPLRPIRGWRRRDERDANGNKFCTECREWLPEGTFGVNRRYADGLADYCRPCRSAQVRLRTFGITPAQYDEVLTAQGGGCAICGDANDIGRSLAIDHDHACCSGDGSCGRCVRGLLCSRCNMGIGQFLESVSRMEAAIAYLKKYAR